MEGASDAHQTGDMENKGKMQVIFLSTEQVIAIHSNQIELYGGQDGIRDYNMLESAVGAPKSSFGGKLLYKTLPEMAAACFFSIINNHAFIDGNKRTAVMTAYVFIYMNGYELQVDEDELVDFAVNVIEQRLSREAIAQFLDKDTVKRAIKSE